MVKFVGYVLTHTCRLQSKTVVPFQVFFSFSDSISSDSSFNHQLLHLFSSKIAPL